MVGVCFQNLLSTKDDYEHCESVDSNCNFASDTEDDASSMETSYSSDKSSPMWCTKYDNERLPSSSDEDELDLLKYTKKRRRRRSRQNYILRK